MITSHAENSAPARLAATLLAAGLATLALVAAGPTAAGPFQQVVAKKKIIVQAAPADQPVVAKKVVVAKRAVVNANGNLINQRLVQQGKPLVYAELLFARGVCKLDQPTLAKIYADSGKALEETADKLAQGQVRRGGLRLFPDAAAVLRHELAAVFKKHLTADQYRIYETESARRDELRRRAGARFLVDCIDREVSLSAEQKARISETLDKNWDGGWTLCLEYLLLGNSYFPSGVDPYVTPELNQAQRAVWQSARKVQFGLSFGPNWGGNGQPDPIPALLGIETKEEVAERESVVKKQAAAAEARQKRLAEMLKRTADAEKAAAKAQGTAGAKAAAQK